MKTRIISGFWIIAILLTILSKATIPATAGPMTSAVPVAFSQGGVFPTAPRFMSYPAPMPQGSYYPLVSAQRACLQGSGWSWRQGQVAMCFKSGHDICPAGHPWMRQMTQRYTICLSVSNPEQFPPATGIY